MQNLPYKKYILLLACLLKLSLGLASPVDNEPRAEGSLKDLWSMLLAEAGIENKEGTLPIGLAKQINGTTVIIALDSLQSSAQGPTFGAFSSIELPGTGTPIAFGARNVLVGPGGLRAAAEGSRLVLESEHRISLSSGMDMIITKDGNNYIEWTCQGFKSIHLKGIIEFNQSIIIPADANTDKGTDGREPVFEKVRASFEIHANDLNNWMIGINMPDFKLPTGGLTIQAQNVWLDLSDLTNPPAMVFPSGYHTGLDDSSINLWRGVYAENIKVGLPKELSSGNCSMAIQATGLIIDNMGVSLKFAVDGVSGCFNADTWPATVDKISVDIMKNKLRGGGLSGIVQIPMLGYESLGYDAEMYQGKNDWNYMFRFKTLDDKVFNMPALSAELKLQKGSQLQLTKNEGKFTVSAILHGKMDIKNKIFNGREIGFQSLTLQSRAPYLVDGIISLSSNKENKVGGFPVSFDSIALNINKGNPILHMGVAINLMDSKSFSGKTSVTIFSEQNPSSDKFSWKIQKVQVDEIWIKSDLGSFKIEGRAAFYHDDAVYGNGFSGAIKLSVGTLLTDIEGQAYFGTKDDFRYWQASVRVPVKIPIPPVPSLFLTSIKGGMSYQMVRPDGYIPSYMETSKSEEVKIGERYIPSKETGLSFLAGVGIGFGERVLGGKAELEVAFLKSGGLSRVNFTGDASFFTDAVDFVKDPNQNSPIKVALNMNYNNSERTFLASLDTKIDVLGLIKGGGRCEIFMSPSDWHFYVGRPIQPLYLDVLSIAKFKSYFMAGTNLDPLPTHDDLRAAGILSSTQRKLLGSETLLTGGQGFAFGARFDASFGFGQDKGFIYAYFDIGAGTDIMLRNYGSATCKNKQGKIGINGWYASGQAYAYFQGALGIRAMRKKFDILSLSAAFELKAELPNPEWFKADVTARYRLLGGLVKGKVSLGVELGNKCELQTNGDELGMKMIGDITPVDADSEVSVFASPQVAFNTSLDTEFQMENIHNTVESYRVLLDECKVTSPAGAIVGQSELLNDKTSLVYNTHDVLPPQSKVDVSVKVHVEKKQGASGWKPFTDDKGDILHESKSVSFTTGTAPDHITPDNVNISYPIETQYHFYTEEYDKGYIQLKRGVPYLFAKKDESGEWDYTARFTNAQGNTAETPLSYSEGSKTVNFSIPKGLNLSTVYKMNVIRKLKSESNSNQKNVNQKTVKVEKTDMIDETEIQDNTLKGTLVQGVEKDLFAINFRTSKYTTFASKFKAATPFMDDVSVTTVEEARVLSNPLNMDECLDYFESMGSEGSFPPLITGVATGKEKWFTDFLNPVMYSEYGKGDASIKISRAEQPIGIPPLKAIRAYNGNSDNFNLKLTTNHIYSGNAPTLRGRVNLEYHVSIYTSVDFRELRDRAGRYIDISTAPENAKLLLSVRGYIDILKDKYSYELQYRLPCGTITSKIPYKVQFK